MLFHYIGNRAIIPIYRIKGKRGDKMRKYLLFFALLTLLLVDNASAQTKANPTNEQLKTQITELEKEVDELKNDMHDSLLNREKDTSSRIHNATILFIAIVSFFVTVGGIIIGLLIHKLDTYQKKLIAHQKKFDFVLDSKDFDSKLEAINQRLATIRFEERLNIISTVIRKFKTLCKEIDKIISDVQFAKENAVIDIEVLEEILNRDGGRDNRDWDSNIYLYEKEKKEFIDTLGHEITPMDDEEEGETVEEALVSHIEDLESVFEDFERIEKEINAKILLKN
jgi:hypothetical protein